MQQAIDLHEALPFSILLTPQEQSQLSVWDRQFLRSLYDADFNRQSVNQTLQSIAYGIEHPNLQPYSEELLQMVNLQHYGNRFNPIFFTAPAYDDQLFLDEHQNQEEEQKENQQQLDFFQEGPFQVDIRELSNNDVQYGNDVWKYQIGDNYYSFNQGNYPNPVADHAIPHLLTNVFIPGNQHSSEGPNLVFDQDYNKFTGEKLIKPMFAIPRLTRLNNQNWEEMLDRGGIKLIRIQERPGFPIFEEDDYQEGESEPIRNQIAHQIATTFRNSITHILGNTHLWDYVALRFFLNIGATGTNLETDRPAHINFQTIFPILPDDSRQEIERKVYNHVFSQVKEAVSIQYYYEALAGILIRVVTGFLLMEHRDLYNNPLRHEKQVIKKVRGYHRGTTERQWQSLDLTREQTKWKDQSCLTRILLFCINQKNLKGCYITPRTIAKECQIISEFATRGEVYKVWEIIRKSIITDQEVYLFSEGRNHWMPHEPLTNERAFVIVYRKGHAFITNNIRLQAALKERQECFSLFKFIPKPEPDTQKMDLNQIKKQEPRLRRKDLPIMKYAFDIETFTQNTEQIPYCICVINQTGFKESFWGLDCVQQFLRYTIDQAAKNYKNRLEFWSFNGSKFDNILLVSEMLLMTSDVEILGSNTQIKICKFREMFFYDMILMYPGRLIDVAKQLGCETTEKSGLDVANRSRDWYEENRVAVIYYCFQDCQILFQIIEKHYAYKQQWGLENYQMGTNSSLAIKIFTTNFMKERELQGALTREQYERERSSYHGGYTQNFIRGEQRGNIFYYDINSSYPNVMQKVMPTKYVGEKVYQGEQIVEHFLYLIKGKWKASVLAPIYCESFKTGEVANNKTLLYFTKFSIQYRWGVEIKYARDNNLFEKLIIKRVYQYNGSTPFADYVTTLYDLRLKYKRENKMELSQSVKLSLNSLYGKMGQKQFPQVIWAPDADLEQYIDRQDIISFSEVDAVKKIYRLEFCLDQQELNFLGSMVRFAAFITAAARNNLFMMIHKLGFENVLYCDTDSLMSTVPMAPEDIDSERLGAWKLEHKVISLTAWAPKFYRIESVDEKVFEHIKGVRKANYSPDLWKSIKERGKVEIINKNVFRKQFGHIWVENQKKIINVDKRTRDFFNTEIAGLQHSRPYKNMKDYEYFSMMLANEQQLLKEY